MDNIMANPSSMIQNVVNQVTAKTQSDTEQDYSIPPVGYLPSMDPNSWNIYSEITSSKEMSALNLGPLDSFCNSYNCSKKMNAKCNNLTEYNCKRVGCCVFTSNSTCEAGGQNGATYSPNVDYYYYKNKCYGNKCPK
jgi:hypothetical protein